MRRREVLLGLIFLAACKRDDGVAELPPPREVTDSASAQFCGMALTEHAGPKAQIFVRGLTDPYWFASVRDAFAFILLPEMPKAISAVYVSDMARAKNWNQPEPGTWVEAHQAYFVIGSRRRGGMGTGEAIPFSNAAAARRFVDANGGRTIRFAEMPNDYILTATQGDP
ncbi:MAG: nitrous oxide reductase accessory protein NosL [Beijerinckiaceae bacterium]|nr:nitrous oxide reductase accessory protein NosL [Beijerinckiaceae bacterium]